MGIDTVLVEDPQTRCIARCRLGVPAVIGRGGKGLRVDLVCDDSHISRHHCDLHVEPDGRLRIVDRSRYGTFVNGARIQGEGHARPGDKILLGHSYRLVVLQAIEGDKTHHGEAAPVAETLPPTPEPPRPLPRIDARYRLIREIGRGAVGIVYEAFDEHLGARCAIKSLVGAAYNRPDVVARFRREAMLGSRLRDERGIVCAFDLGVLPETGNFYYVMDYVEGSSLQALVQRGQLNRVEGVRIVARVARLVSIAHSKGVVHRDLKPDNVLVTTAGEVYLTDFGVAKALDEGSGITTLGHLIGTPAFMAPEQLEDSMNVGPISDVYGLGAVLYVVLTGRRPIEGTDIEELLANAVAGVFSPPRKIDATIDAELEEICLKAMSRRPQDRPPGARPFAEALERWLTSHAATLDQNLRVNSSGIARLAGVNDSSRFGPRPK